jgi:hypothetical protein
MHAGRAELATKPALVFVGKDHLGHQVLRPQEPCANPNPPATLNRYMQAIAAVFTWAIRSSD